MGGDESGQMGLNCPSEKVIAGLAMNSRNMFRTPNEGGDSFYSCGWDPILSMSESANFGPSSVVAHCGFSTDPFYTSVHGLLPTQEYCQIPEERPQVDSPKGRRKRAYDSTSPLNPNKDLSGEISEPNGSDGKKLKIEPNSGPDQFTKQRGKQVKGNYVHMRAKRGHATNSHSLAARVRREKIGERMRELQELVPGCSKITGKAVMLDEIINYVQSLQQQVEFLSMKLATVNPELNFDINWILSKDILQLRGGDASLLGFNPGTSSTL